MRLSPVQPVTTILLVLHCNTCIVTALAKWGPLPHTFHRPSSTARALSVGHEHSRTRSTECLKTVDVLSLDSIRSSLIRQEETIIFALIERAQFRQNSIVYRQGGFGALGIPPGSMDPNENGMEAAELSFLEYMLVGTETLHCGARRYLSPEEHPFFPERIPSGPMKALPSLQYSPELLSSDGGAADFNFNKRLLCKYLDVIVPSVCQPGDDEQHGSTALCDIAVLQALSRRVHYGKFVAESKYRSDPESYQRLVDAGDTPGVMALLTNAKVEHQVLRRARLKAATYGSEPMLAPHETDATSTWSASASVHDGTHDGTQGKVDPSMIETVYRDIIIPMTKDIEVAYLYLRCGRQPPPEYRE